MPQLGAINYSPILKGSLAAAEGQMRGSEAIARGIASLGQQAAAGIEKYYDKKEANELFSGTSSRVQKILKENPAFAPRFGVKDPSDIKALEAGILAMGGGDKRKASMVTEQLLFQLGTEQEKLRREEAGRRAISDALDPVMALANRQITPDQFTSGQGIGSNQFLMAALGAGAPVEAATRIAGILSDREALAERLGAQRDIAAGEISAKRAAAEAEAAFVPRVKNIGGVNLIETSRGKFEKIKGDESFTLEIPIPGGGVKSVEARLVNGRFIDAKTGQDIYTRSNVYGEQTEQILNPPWLKGFNNSEDGSGLEPENPTPGALPKGWTFQK